MPVIRASEIGSFLFCRRAWSFRALGVEPENRAELAGGVDFHRRHGRGVMRSALLGGLGRVLLLLAIVAGGVALALWLST